MSNSLVSESGEQHNNNKNNDKSLIGHIVNDLGGVLFAVEAIDKTLDFASKGFRNNKLYQGGIKVLRGLSPVVLTTHKINNSYKSYKEQKKQQYARQKKDYTILKIMEMEHLDEYELDSYEFAIGKEIITWFNTKPNTTAFKIINFFNSEFESVSSKNMEPGEFYIYVEFENNKYMIEADIQIINQTVFVSNCWVHATGRYEKIKELRNAIFSEFIKYFDTAKNIIEMNAKGLQTRPRLSFDYEVEQFDVYALKNEIEKAVSKGKKRGYIMVGPPGVGKSTVIIKIEKELPDIPIVYISSSGSIFREDIVNVFNFLRSISPCIAIFEDLDSFELSHKQDKIFGEFIEQMDALKHSECIIIIATLNEPENVHPSLINRRGRFDKVFFVDYPKSESQIIGVMRNRYKCELGKELPFDTLKKESVKKIVSHSFSHADICEVIDHLIINDIKIDEKSIDDSINEVVKTMMAVGQCNGEEDDDDD